MVDTDKIRAAAASGAEKARAFSELIQDMEQLMGNSQTVWQGGAADLYRDTFAREVKSLKEAFGAFKLYVRGLNEYADTYEGVSRAAEQVASVIELASWAEV